MLVTSVVVATTVVGLGHELPLGNLAQLWLAAWLLFVAFMSLAFAVSVNADRAGPAIGIPAAFILVNYLAWAIGSLWPDMRWLEDCVDVQPAEGAGRADVRAGAQRRAGPAGLHGDLPGPARSIASRGATCPRPS